MKLQKTTFDNQYNLKALFTMDDAKKLVSIGRLTICTMLLLCAMATAAAAQAPCSGTVVYSPASPVPFGQGINVRGDIVGPDNLPYERTVGALTLDGVTIATIEEAPAQFTQINNLKLSPGVHTFVWSCSVSMNGTGAGTNSGSVQVTVSQP